MSRTRRKLDEASFFLCHLKMAEKKVPDFDFFLNAFAAAARSISWVMKAEYGKIPGWLDWYNIQEPDAGEEKLLALFTKLRNKSQKEEPLMTNTVIILNFPPESLTPEFKEILSSGSEKKFNLTLHAIPEDGDMGRIPTGAVLGTVQAAEHRLKELAERNVLVACNEYYAALERLVNRCETGFSP